MRGPIVIAAMAALAACSGYSSHARDGSGTAVRSGETAQREFALADFTEVSLRGPDNVEVSIGEAFAIRAEGDAEAIADLEIEVRGNTLRIGRDSDGWFGGNHNGRATIYVTMPVVRGASISGSGDMTVERASSDRFEASIAGSGNLVIAALEAGSAEFDIAGSGDITAAGSSADVEIGIAGSGNVVIGDLRAERIDVSIAGSGDVDAFATDSVDASIVGSGDVRVRGGAQCQSSSMGSGDLRCS